MVGEALQSLRVVFVQEARLPQASGRVHAAPCRCSGFLEVVGVLKSFVGRQDVEVAVVDEDGLARQADEPLDEVDRHAVLERALGWKTSVAGKLEDDHVEAVGRRVEKVVHELGRQDAVAAADFGVGELGRPGQVAALIGRFKANVLTAVGASAAADPDVVRFHGIDLIAAIDGEAVAAAGADDPLLIAEKGFGHRAGGDDVGLGVERFEQHHENDDGDEHFDGFADGAGGWTVGRRRGVRRGFEFIPRRQPQQANDGTVEEDSEQQSRADGQPDVAAPNLELPQHEVEDKPEDGADGRADENVSERAEKALRGFRPGETRRRRRDGRGRGHVHGRRRQRRWRRLDMGGIRVGARGIGVVGHEAPMSLRLLYQPETPARGWTASLASATGW